LTVPLLPEPPIKLGRKEFVQELLKKGADINAVAADGHNALSLAAEHGQAEIAELLIDHSADVDSPSNRGRLS